jgi:hypothetical protein
MGAVDSIMIAEEAVSQLQDQLAAVENVLDVAEDIAVKGEKAGRCLRRLFRVLLLVAIVAAVVMVIRKLMGCRSPGDEVTVVEMESAPDAGEEAPDHEVLDGAEDAYDEETDAS